MDQTCRTQGDESRPKAVPHGPVFRLRHFSPPGEAVAQWQASLKDFQKGAPADNDPEEVAKVTKKLDDAQAKLARESHR